MTDSLVEVTRLTKSYSDLVALNDCTVAVARGEVFGLLGPNGSGKSTLLRILTGMVRPSSGDARIAGFDCWHDSIHVRQQTAYLPGDARLFGWQRGKDVLELMASARANSSPTQSIFEASVEIAERLQLDLRRRVAMMSTGMRQKLAIAVTMSAASPVLILDEPTANLDPTVRMEVLQMVRESQSRGQTVLFSSHVLSETEEVCDRVLLLRYGETKHLQEMSQLRRGHRIWLQPRDASDVPRWVRQLASSDRLREHVSVHPGPDSVRVDVESDLSIVLEWISQASVESIRIEPMGLKTVYEEHFGTSLEAVPEISTDGNATDHDRLTTID